MSDAVAIFWEGTFEEQVSQILTSLTLDRSKNSSTASSANLKKSAIFIRPFQDALKGAKPLDEDKDRRRKGTLRRWLLGMNRTTLAEIEGFFNLINAHLLSLYAPTRQNQVNTYLHSLFSASEQRQLKYRLLSNLFNRYHRSVSLCTRALLDLAIANEELEALQLTRTDVEKCSQTRTKKFGQRPKAYEYSIAYVRSLTPGSSSANTAAVELISMALRLPLVFDFDPLFKVEAVVALKAHEALRAIQTPSRSTVRHLTPASIPFPKLIPYLAPTELDAAQLERKIRLLTLASIGFQNIGQDLASAKIARSAPGAFHRGRKMGHRRHPHRPASGKLSQTSQTLHITRAKARSFEYFAISVWAAHRLGATVFTLNPTFGAEEILLFTRDIKPALLFVQPIALVAATTAATTVGLSSDRIVLLATDIVVIPHPLAT
ncbi:Eukaryotic translation initiation factor 3 subunit M [Mycena chlorophos]|uniref:Eukaryotic translation initiation factor 3 subunit M n=1 Tax=Mycena chlorophos TaxID=658473 RepID=A0A8H6VVZ3_MYCCL|nr:Eukaryotic translation initiation factor 3 subunit M [Mycena chlorophos]